MPSLETGSAGAPLRLLPQVEQLGALTAYIEEFAEAQGWAAADTMAFTLAAEELFANTVRHGDPTARSVEFLLTASAGEALAVYSDDAGEFDPTAFPEVDTSLPLEQRPIGGLGIHFIRKTMSRFSYRREGGRNVITFGRALGAESG
jgi:anti-sigma regulatory factor (Ser/Thr protein kinase)